MLFTLLFVARISAAECNLLLSSTENFIAELAEYPATQSLVRQLHQFAVENDLPERIVEVGPPQRRVKRLLVALDPEDKILTAKYLRAFNLDEGALSFEFSYESQPEDHLYTMVRTSGDPDAPVYMYGRPDMTWTDHIRNYTKDRKLIHGQAHLFALTGPERANVLNYLDRPQDRAPEDPGRANCISWSCGIELGKTYPEASDEERRYLFSELGLSRTIATFEVARRWMHATSQRHAAVVTYVKGEAGRREFLQADKSTLTGFDPKIPFEAVIRDLPLLDTHPALKAVAALPDGARVFFPIAAGASPTAFHAMMQRSAGLEKGYHAYLLVNGISENVLTRALNAPAKMKITSFFLGGNLRRLYKRGAVEVIPDYLSQITRRLRDQNFDGYDFDAMVVRVAPPDEQGRYSLGPNNDMILSILKARPGIKIIAEINPNVPRTRGAYLTADQITASFADRVELASPVRLPVTEVEENIGHGIASLIPDGAFMQIGIGNVFDGLPKAMKQADRKGVRFFTEMMGDPMMDMLKSRVASSAKTGFAFGTRKLYQWLHNKRRVEFVETEKVNSPLVIGAKPSFHAVNTALQINLRGDANATHGPDGQRMSSTGGQMDFMIGAGQSEGGKSIIALRSTAKHGTVSTIALDLYGGNVTTPHELVSHVVTEYGVAVLRGKSERERALALLNIAHPDFRESLFQQAVERKILREEDRP